MRYSAMFFFQCRVKVDPALYTNLFNPSGVGRMLTAAKGKTQKKRWFVDAYYHVSNSSMT